MTLYELRAFLGWCAVINFGILLLWFVFIVLGRDLVYRIHGKWFNITPESMSSIHYKFMGFYKLTVFVFNVVPYLALRIIG